MKLKTEKDPLLEAYIDANIDTLRDAYEQHIYEMQDCPSHQHMMLHSDECFEEWCADEMEKVQ